MELLSVDNLPNVVSISSCTSMFSLICYEICGSMIDTSNINVPVTTAVLESIEAQNQNYLPNVVEPFEAQNNIQLPSEPRSPILKQAFNSIMQNVDSNTDPRRAIKKVVMKSLGERDYAAQETMHHLLSLKLHSSSFKVMPISLNGSRRVRD